MDHSSALAQRLYRYTSLLRLPDLRRTHHKVLLVLLVGASVAAVLLAVRKDASSSQMVWAGALGWFGGYGVWALARELVVEEHWSLWLAVPAAVWTIHEGRELSLWLLFATLAITRMVARSTGRYSWVDSAATCGLIFAATIYTENVIFWFPCMLAFVVDAHTQGGDKRQWMFALLCAGGGVYYDYTHFPMMRELGFATLPPWSRWLLVLLGVTLVLAWLSQPAEARSKKDGEVVSKARLRGALLLTLFCTLTLMFQGYLGLLMSGFLWMAIVTVAVSSLIGLGQLLRSSK